MGVLGTWMTFKKAEMAKTLRNGLSMSKMDPLNHKWLDFAIWLGLVLHQFQKNTAVKRETLMSGYLAFVFAKASAS